MHIALYHNLPSGGAKRAAHELVRRLAQHHTIDVYSLSSAEHVFADIRPYARTHRVYDFTPARLLRSPWGRLNQALRLGDLLRLQRLARTIADDIEETGYDLVFVHGCRFEKAPSLLQHLQRTPTAYYCQESLRHLYEPIPTRAYERRTRARILLDRVDPLPGLYTRRLKSQDWRNLHRAQCVLVNSEYSRREIARIYHIDPQVSYLGVDVTRFRPLTPMHSSRAGYVLSVGSLTPLKGFDFVIEALAQIPAPARPAFVIASNFQNPPERAYLESLAARSHVDLTLLDQVSDERLVELYNEAALTAYAPIREPFGLVAIESMACGAPVVGVAEGGIQETVRDGETGLLTARDARQFAAAIQRLLADPPLATRMGIQGREYVLSQWRWDQAATRLEDHLLDLVSR